MALINCPECGKEISDKSKVCIHCGYPISEEIVEKKDKVKTGLSCPDFPDDLDIGERLGFERDCVIDCSFDKNNNYKVNQLKNVPICTLGLYKNGIRISNYSNTIFTIHKSQIISLEQMSEKETVEKNKSVIGRAIVGGVLTGGVGAVVGGMSGIGKKQQVVETYFLTIKMWDIESKTNQKLIFNSKNSMLSFINKFYRDVRTK